MSHARSFQDSAQTPLNYAYSLLTRGDYSEARLGEKLRAKGFTSQAVLATVDTLRERGHLNDARLALGLAERFQKQGFGPRGVRAKLKQRGLTEDVIATVLSEWAEQTDIEIAQRLVQRRFPPAALAEPKLRARAYRLLLRRGYSAGVAASVLGRDGDND